MNEPAAKQRQMINLDEFERRLNRTSAPAPAPAPARGGDPLAELAKLVGVDQDRFESMFQARPARSETPEPQTEPELPEDHTAHHVPDWLVEESHQHTRPAPRREQPAPRREQPAPRRDMNPTPRRNVDFAAIEAGLRGSLPSEFHNVPEPEDASFEEDAHWLDARYVPSDAPAPVREAPRSRVPLYATAAVIIAGMLGIGGTFALKRSPAAPQQIAMIKASAEPFKVAVRSDPDANSSQNASLLDKTPQPAPVAAVSHTEQPVDVNAVGKPAPQVAATAPASAVPVPPLPGADSQNAGMPGAALADTMQPRRVKTINVRPDGSFASDSAAPQAVDQTAPDQQAAAQPAAGQPAPVAAITPPSMASAYANTDAPPAPAAAPEPSRIPPAESDMPWSSQTAQAQPETHSPKPVHVARAETGADEATAAPSHGAGGFSVQLAAPASEAEAHAAILRASRSFGAILHGYHVKYRQAKVGTKTVYRVRVSSLSHEAAISLCQRLKAKGGACFVAHD